MESFRKSCPRATSKIDSNTNRFQPNQGYTFDKNGNLIVDPVGGGRAFVFNGDNKQSEVRDAGGVLVGKYFYDGEGRRVRKELYSGGVVSETTIFVYSNGKLIAEYSTAPPPQNPTTNYTVTDQLGSPRVIVNALGQVTSRRDFMPFGEELAPDPNNRTAGLKYGASDNIRQKFTGYQKDDETGLDFAEARMYENRHGRFTAVDPLLASGKSSNPQTFNRYVYVLNNPQIFTDPTGLQAGKWYKPKEPDNEKEYVYVLNILNNPPADYVEVTERNKRGHIVGGGVGVPDGYEVRLNPSGPCMCQGFGPIGNLGAFMIMSDYNYQGWTIQRNDAEAEIFYRSGRVDDVTMDIVLFASALRVPARTGNLSFSGRNTFRAATTETETLPASALQFTDKIQKNRLEAIADSIYKEGVKEPIDYTVIDGKNYILDGNHRGVLGQLFNLEVPVRRQTLPFGSWKSEEDVLLNNALYSRPFLQTGCRFFCKNYKPPGTQ